MLKEDLVNVLKSAITKVLTNLLKIAKKVMPD